MRISKAILSCLILVVGFSTPSFASNLTVSGLQQSFDWQKAWGSIDFSEKGGDTGIPTDKFQPKKDIEAIVSTEGTQSTDLTSLKAYTLDLNNDGIADFVLDGNGYFPQYQNPQAATQICTAADGCYVSIYIVGEATNLISAPATGAPTCPATAEANTACIASCAATTQNCPALFKYNTNTAFDEQVLAWNFITAADFQAWATGSYQLHNTNPVLVALRNNTNCYNAELAVNNNQCVKYYQFVGDVNTGSFVDLFNYNPPDHANGDYLPRFTYTPFDADIAHVFDLPSDPAQPVPQPGMVMGNGYAHKLVAGGSIDLQFRNFAFINTNGTTTPAISTPYGFPAKTGLAAHPGFASFHIENASNSNYFVPVNTNMEFCAFVNSHQTGVTITPEKLHFTAWTGDLTCPTNLTAPETIAAQRFCQSSTSDYRPCQACINAKVPGYEQGCTVKQNCPVNTCRINKTVNIPGYGKYAGTYTSEGECEKEFAPYYGTYTTVPLGSFPNNYWLYTNPASNAGQPPTGAVGANLMTNQFCRDTFANLCAWGHICLSGDALISLPDGTTKRIDAIKAGDMVLGFGKPKGALKPYRVTTLTVTPNEPLLSINGELNLTANHQVITAKGVAVRASALKVGDVLLRGDKTRLKVTSIEPVETTGTVYNLVLDKGAGFVANGIRVADYAH